MKDSESHDQHGFRPKAMVAISQVDNWETIAVGFSISCCFRYNLQTDKHPGIYSVFSFAVTNQCPPRALDCDENLAPDKQLTLDDASASWYPSSHTHCDTDVAPVEAVEEKAGHALHDGPTAATRDTSKVPKTEA